MKKCLAILFIFSSNTVFSQQLTTPPTGGNKKAWVGERVGLTDVTINYNRPTVKGREGKIWGELVHYGYKNLNYGTSTSSPWRAGANENTTIEFSNAVKIEGKDIPAGKYGFFIELQPDHCILIFSKRNTSWGSFFYDPKEDAIRVTVTQKTMEKSEEWLKYEFSEESSSGATISLIWEKLKIPFRIETNLIEDQLNIFRKELSSSKSSDWKNWNQAANYALNNNADLSEALTWANYSIMMPSVGELNFTTASTKSAILEKLGKKTEADSIIKNVLPIAKKEELYSYTLNLIKNKRIPDAIEVSKFSYKKFPNEYLPALSMTRSYSAKSEFENALTYAKIALSLAPNPQSKTAMEDKIKKLENKVDIN